MTRPKTILATVVLLAGLSAIADLITISQYDFHLWDPFVGNSSTDHSASPSRSASPRPALTLTATPTPTPVPPLDRQLEEALSVSGSSGRDAALFIATQDAVLTKDYWTAIRAAGASPSSSSQARSLGLVVRCAIEDGLYDLAAKAASKVRSPSSRDSLKIKVIDARRMADSEVATSSVGRDNRRSMACFSSIPR